MSYQYYEESASAGQPIELYKFVEGGNVNLFCTHHEQIEFNGEIYNPSSLKRDRVKQTTDSFKNSLSLKMPRTDLFAMSFITQTPEDKTVLTIFRGHYGDITSDGFDFQVYWKGRVLGAEISGNEVTLVCESIFTSLRRTGIRARYEYSCRHPLYASGCSVNKSLFITNGTLSAISSNRLTLTVNECSLKPNGYFSGGFIEINGIKRFISIHSGASLQLMNSFAIDDIAIGQPVGVYAGCDHLKTTCENKFNNVINFGGFPYIPSRNPFNNTPF